MEKLVRKVAGGGFRPEASSPRYAKRIEVLQPSAPSANVQKKAVTVVWRPTHQAVLLLDDLREHGHIGIVFDTLVLIEEDNRVRASNRGKLPRHDVSHSERRIGQCVEVGRRETIRLT